MYFSSPKLARLFGVTVRTIDRWVDAGLLHPIGETAYSHPIADVLPFAIGRDLLARGFTAELSTEATNWIRSRSIDELRDDWQQGRNLMLLIGEQPHYGRQFTHEEVFENPAVDLFAVLKLGIPLAVVNVEKAYDELATKAAEPVEAVRR